jgi:hypothetical protein
MIWSWPLVQSAQARADNTFQGQLAQSLGPVECVASFSGVRLSEPLAETSRLWLAGQWCDSVDHDRGSGQDSRSPVGVCAT